MQVNRLWFLLALIINILNPKHLAEGTGSLGILLRFLYWLVGALSTYLPNKFSELAC